MNRNLKQYSTLLWQSIFFWGIALGCYVIFRFFGIDEEVGIQTNPDFRFKEALFAFVILGMFLGLIYATVDFIFDKFFSKQITLGLRIIVKSFIDFTITITIFTMMLKISSKIFNVDFNTEQGWWRDDKSFWAIIIYLVLVSFVFSFITIAVEKFGKGVFLKMLLGKYKNPQEEKRIFMFLDLKDSITIAENLGHYAYSQFIQDCFYDLNDVVPKYDAEIYQYVGDEAVLCWPYRKGISQQKCIGIFFSFKNNLDEKKEYYLNKYGVSPEFKAGLHGGQIMVSEVGTVKKELAYHGDVINISARIQSQCNTYNEFFLISSELLSDIQIEEEFSVKEIGALKLKGKNELVDICAIQQMAEI
ncbi:adenylate/guanylate cyclase domain-containing protein [Aquimarina algiphila]|uniref:adenylate/guanylate cyclase domain-containing protein n=1 Tax=Aquimarina algiphila TaxID=2047982 RepID=UPI00232EB842|nr:adenylate/guanylate cyclase domain-containing protein [Aquimarina algiphila]